MNERHQNWLEMGDTQFAMKRLRLFQKNTSGSKEHESPLEQHCPFQLKFESTMPSSARQLGQDTGRRTPGQTLSLTDILDSMSEESPRYNYPTRPIRCHAQMDQQISSRYPIKRMISFGPAKKLLVSQTVEAGDSDIDIKTDSSFEE